MPRSFDLSNAALDIVWGRLGLGFPPYPLEIPRLSRTRDERAAIATAVFQDLQSRGLARGDLPEPGVADTLTLVARPQLAVTAFGTLDNGHKLFARLARTSDTAVLAVKYANGARFSHVRPVSALATVVDLLPDERPGAARSVTFAQEPAGPVHGDRVHPSWMTENRPSGTRSEDLRIAQTIFRHPTRRSGMFGVTTRDRTGRENRLTDTGWLDTDGRYLMHTRRGTDGRNWITYSPADRSLFVRHLATLIG